MKAKPDPLSRPADPARRAELDQALERLSSDVAVICDELRAGQDPEALRVRLAGELQGLIKDWEQRHPRRRRGRPAKTILGGLSFTPKRQRGRPLEYDQLVLLVDDWKRRRLARDGARLSDAQALAEMLHHHAPLEIRTAIDAALVKKRRAAKGRDERFLLRHAVEEVDGNRLERLLKRLSEHRRRRRESTSDK